MPRIQKHRWRKTSLLLFTSSLLAKSGLEVTPLCREATQAVSIDIELERLRDQLRLRDRDHVPRPAAESLSVMHQSGATSRSCAVRAQKKMTSSRWTFRSNKNLKKEQDGGKSEKILFAVFDELFVENLGSSVGKCVLAARCWGDVCAIGLGRYGRSKVVEIFRRLRDGDPVEIEKNFRCSSDSLVVSSMSTGITCGQQGDACARVITLRHSHQRLQQCAEMASGLFHEDSLLA